MLATDDSDAPTAIPGPAVLLGALDLHGAARLLAIAPALALSCWFVDLATLDAGHVVSSVHAGRVAVGRCIDG